MFNGNVKRSPSEFTNKQSLQSFKRRLEQNHFFPDTVKVMKGVRFLLLEFACTSFIPESRVLSICLWIKFNIRDREIFFIHWFIYPDVGNVAVTNILQLDVSETELFETQF